LGFHGVAATSAKVIGVSAAAIGGVGVVLGAAALLYVACAIASALGRR